MAMVAEDRLLANPRGSASETVKYFLAIPEVVARWDAFLDYVESVYELAPMVGVDPSIVMAQSAHETANFTSYWWRERLNPAGLGVTGTASQDALSPTFLTGRAA